MANNKIPDEELSLDVQAYYDAAGSKSEAARQRGIPNSTFGDRLKMAENRLGIKLGKVADGRISPVEHETRKLPKKGHINRYLLTSIQNNTMLHPGFNNLLAYRDWLDDRPTGNCELIVGTFSYQKNAYGSKAVKRGTLDPHRSEPEWYAPEAEEFIQDKSVELAPGLIWCGEQNILPTNKNPLTGMDGYNGRASNIVPHAKIAMESIASMPDEGTKFNYATGTMTQRNYIQKRMGIIAEQSHNYGALLVEVDSNGSWWVRQLELGNDDSIMDIGPADYQGVYVQLGEVHPEQVVSSWTWADYHAAGMDPAVHEMAWGKGGMLDTHRCDTQFMGDVLSMRSRSPHEEHDFHRTFTKMIEGENEVEEEVQLTADLLSKSMRRWCETIIVQANHDDHLTQWLNFADFRKDPANARYFCELQARLLQALEDGDRDFKIMEHALVRADINISNAYFLGTDESYVILKDIDGAGIECALHGHRGPNGARGSTKNLTKLGRKVTKGHDHKATIDGNVHSVGTCTLNEPYAHGPGSWSVTHSATYRNGSRALLTCWNGRWRA